MHLFNIKVRILFMTITIFGATLVSPVLAQDNRFLVAKDFSAIFTPVNSFQGDISVSFYVENVSPGGISIIFMPSQLHNTIVSHPLAASCDTTSASGIPVYGDLYTWREDLARRTAVYIPKGTGVIATVRKNVCRAEGNSRAITNGVFSGNVTVIKGNRILTRPISGRF